MPSRVSRGQSICDQESPAIDVRHKWEPAIVSIVASVSEDVTMSDDVTPTNDVI
jgi:hypothetical protein